MLLWGPSPFRFCNSWLTIKDCNQVIKGVLNSSNGNGWVDFILHEELRKVKAAIKAWNASFQASLKQKEDSLLNDLETRDSIAESVGLNDDELAFRSTHQAELLSL